MTQKMPLLFIGHGSPMNALEENKYTQSWKEIWKKLPKPRAILVFSAHWITENETRIWTGNFPSMIYDMYGFPSELYKVNYPASGSPEIANEIYETLSEAWINISKDPDRGFDHGIWSTLIHIFPEADIPVIPISLDYFASPESLVQFWELLADFRKKWILIIGSGNIVHNLRMIDFSGSQIYPWAREFDKRVTDGLESWKNTPFWNEILQFQSWWKISELAHPSYDHLLPLFPLMGASSAEDRVEFFTPDIDMGSLSMRSILWSE